MGDIDDKGFMGRRGKDTTPAELKRPTSKARNQDEAENIETDIPIGTHRPEGPIAHQVAAAGSMADDEAGASADEAGRGRITPLRKR